MTLLNQILFITGILSAASITFAAPQTPNMYFSVRRVQLVDVRKVDFDVFGLISKKQYFLESCLLLNSMMMPAGLKFNLTRNSEKRVTVITNTNGCIQWSETLEFSPVAKETHYNFSYTVTADRGWIAGQVKLNFDINPYQHELIDRSSSNLSADLK